MAAVLSANTAKSTDGTTPLPYWRDPKRAAAEPDISLDTVFSAAAFAHAATIPFILNTKNIGITIPNSPNECVTPIIAKITEKIKAGEVDMARSRLILTSANPITKPVTVNSARPPKSACIEGIAGK
ncbi:hypothetical protein LSA36186_24040 [Lachnoanaerobaculum sp. JCM 36186]|nr:hypothetical protein LSA36186_24040 [Lachnoanaerobaculum sp. JCM 36186]